MSQTTIGDHRHWRTTEPEHLLDGATIEVYQALAQQGQYDMIVQCQYGAQIPAFYEVAAKRLKVIGDLYYDRDSPVLAKLLQDSVIIPPLELQVTRADGVIVNLLQYLLQMCLGYEDAANASDRAVCVGGYAIALAYGADFAGLLRPDSAVEGGPSDCWLRS
jgi:hypothetical protein